MNIQTITKILTDAGIEENEARCEVKMLLEHFCKYTEKDKLMGIMPDEVQLNLLKEKVEKRVKDRMPVQYIIGEAYFMGEYYKVTPDVLIPRDETEILVRRAIELIKRKADRLTPHPNPLLKERERVRVLDIGTGSGCIACTIAKQTDATVLGVDISSDALRVALDNVTKLGLNNRAVFRKSDLFEKVHEDERFDVIISNPPYIKEGEELSQEVMHEPAQALFAQENGLYFYRKIIENAPDFLNNGGYLMFELGIGESDAVKDMMQKRFKDIQIEKDLAWIDRVIWGKVNK